jgi:TRAP-type transport system periplasmic protein
LSNVTVTERPSRNRPPGLDCPVGYPGGYTATKPVNGYFNKFRSREFDEVKVMRLHACGPGYLHIGTKPVNKLEDLKKLRIRTFGSTARFMSLLGRDACGHAHG